jgi:hypothetical protein
VKSLGIAALVLAACLGNCDQIAAENSRGFALGGPILSYIAEHDGHYRWIFWSASSRQKETFLELPEAPKLVFWDTQKMRVYYAIGSRILSAAYPQRHSAPSYIATLPPGDVQVMWVQRSSGRLRAVKVESAAASNNNDGTTTYSLEDGTSVRGFDFPDGIPGVCTVLELRRNGKWVPVVRRASVFEAGDTPGLGVVNDFRYERGASQDTLLMSYTYAYGKMIGKDLRKTLISGLANAGISSPSDFPYVSEQSGAAELVFHTGEGDTVHAETPVFLVSRTDQLTRLKLRDGYKQIGLGRSGRYLLIEDEYSGDNPTVIDLKTSKTLINERAQSSVWVPFPSRTRF